jgi:hypothetical protein
MQIIGTDKSGAPIAVERGLFATTYYRGRRRRAGGTAFLGDPYSVDPGVLSSLQTGGDSGGFDWSALFTGLNPVLQGVGARISGGYPYPYPQPGQVPVNPYMLQQSPTASASISPMLLIGGLGLAAIMLMKK